MYCESQSISQSQGPPLPLPIVQPSDVYYMPRGHVQAWQHNPVYTSVRSVYYRVVRPGLSIDRPLGPYYDPF